MRIRFDNIAIGYKRYAIRRMRSGFTLIELLVVIAIIGVLAGVILISLNDARIRGRDARRISDLEAISVAMELYNEVNDGTYPDIVGGTTFSAATFDAMVAALVNDGYLPATPQDPLGNRSYAAQLSTATDPLSYVIGADLERSMQACSVDYDGGDVSGMATTCDDGGVPICEDAEPAGDVADFCICHGPNCG